MSAELGRAPDVWVWSLSTVAIVLILAGVGVPSAIVVEGLVGQSSISPQVLTGVTLFRVGLVVTGIFFATTEWATRKNISEEQYLQYGEPYDLRVLARAKGAEMNILHVCMEYNMLPLFKNYPIDILSWNKFEPGNMDFAQAHNIFSQPFLGGVDHLNTLIDGGAGDVTNQIHESLEDAGSHPLIIAPGCTMKLGTKEENVKALREAINIKERLYG